jgi:LCP family protein required for cell wall assembly
VRTTLKRGLGRASANGNGRAILPPGALTPITRYRQPDPRRRGPLRLVGRVVVWLAALVSMVVVGLLGGAYLFFHESIASTHPHSADVKQAAPYLNDVPPPTHAAIALVLGYDHRASDAKGTPSRSDTVMLLRADPETKSVSMLSFPRDLVVDVYCPHSPTPVARDRINSAYSRCGAPGTLLTVKKLTGLPVNYLITVDFHGFKAVVNTLHGVWVDVDRRYFNDNAGLGPGFTYARINLKPGYQRLTGGAALDYVRYRHTDSDLYRVARQQLFLQALKARFQSTISWTPSSFLTVAKLVKGLTSNVEIEAAGGKGISGSTLLSYAKFAHNLPGGHFFQSKIGGLEGYAELYTDPSNVEAAVKDFASPDVQAPKIATAVALGRKIKTAAPKPEATSVTVLNGNGVVGSASTASYELGQRGYKIVTPPSGATGNAPRQDYFQTTIYYNPAKAGAEAAAKALEKLFAPAVSQKLAPIIKPLSNGSMITVVVGRTYHGEIAPPPEQTVPKREPPNVTYEPSPSEPLVREAQKQVPYKLEVPTVLERSSAPDPELPLRVYAIEGQHKAVRLTYRTGGREYWGVEMTDWDGAPVLDDPNTIQWLAGRKFSLYYHGAHLRMVVLRVGKTSFWVVNTLLDSLSNETMLAIAKGLRPLGTD